MPSLFPRHTIELRLEEPRAFRRLSFSLVEMALITGVVFRLFRAFALAHRGSNLLYVAELALALVLLLGMATAHLANYPLPRWVWRAPLFAVVETTAEMATSLLLIWLGREPNGSVRAELGDWPSMAVGALWSRVLVIVLWSLLLAGVISLVRRAGVAEEEEPDAPHAPNGVV